MVELAWSSDGTVLFDAGDGVIRICVAPGAGSALILAHWANGTAHRLFCEELMQIMCRIHEDHSQHVDETTVGKIVSLSSIFSGICPLEID